MRFTLSAIVVILLSTAAIPAAAQSEGTKLMISSDERSQVVVPMSWTRLDLNENAELQVGNAEDETYLIILNELKDDLYGWNIDKHSRVTMANLISSLAFPTIEGPRAMTINGHPAVQYEIRGASENLNVIYLHTTIETPEMFSQVLAWTLPSRWEQSRSLLHKVIGSYKKPIH